MPCKSIGLTNGIPPFLAVWMADLTPWLRPKALTAEAQKVTSTRGEATFMVDLKWGVGSGCCVSKMKEN